MSIESAKAYVKKMKTDKVFRAEVEKATDNQIRTNIVAKAGFKFTPGELRRAVAAMMAPQGLSDAQLDAVAGGVHHADAVDAVDVVEAADAL